jgi:hypothetical protein
MSENLICYSEDLVRFRERFGLGDLIHLIKGFKGFSGELVPTPLPVFFRVNVTWGKSASGLNA